ncbi:hypothetical protein BS17DRAFT_555612 [Gyrodon lividus]|nr:hypothetical protein BS17DRAFT_555612 [Gyrodon lividus]
MLSYSRTGASHPVEHSTDFNLNYLGHSAWSLTKACKPKSFNYRHHSTTDTTRLPTPLDYRHHRHHSTTDVTDKYFSIIGLPFFFISICLTHRNMYNYLLLSPRLIAHAHTRSVSSIRLAMNLLTKKSCADTSAIHLINRKRSIGSPPLTNFGKGVCWHK